MTENRRKRVMVAYDGSRSSDAAIGDLRFAGIPADAEIRIALAIDLFEGSGEPASFDLRSMASRRVAALVSNLTGYRENAMREAQRSVAKAVDWLRVDFPRAKLDHKVLEGKPAPQILAEAAEWQPDLIVAGSHGHSVIGRIFHGSVSHSLAAEASAAVRIVRDVERASNGSRRILLAARCPSDGDQLAREVTARDWAGDEAFRLLIVDDRHQPSIDNLRQIEDVDVFKGVVEQFAARGLQFSVDVLAGEPNRLLLDEIDRWYADSIMISVDGMDGPGLDATAETLLSDAPTTVEIVRRPVPEKA